MKYKIVASYQTGNSFGHEDTTCDVTEHDDLTVAKENLLRIREHLKFFNQADNPRSRGKQRELFDAHMNERWFVNSPKLYHLEQDQAVDRMKKGKEADYGYRPDPYHAVHCLKLKLDNGEDFQLSAPWCGYFERLNALEIVLNDEDEELRIEF